jgi:hypothetical protein
MFIHESNSAKNFIFYNKETGEISSTPFPEDRFDNIVVIDAMDYGGGLVVFRTRDSASVSRPKHDLEIFYAVKGTDIRGSYTFPKGQNEFRTDLPDNSPNTIRNFYCYIKTPVIDKTCYAINNVNFEASAGANILGAFPNNYIIGSIEKNVNVEFSSLGDFVVIGTDNNVYYINYAQREIDGYVFSDYRLLPPLPEMELSLTVSTQRILEEQEDRKWIKKDNYDFAIPNDMTGRFCVRCALVMKSGEFINVSSIYTSYSKWQYRPTTPKVVEASALSIGLKFPYTNKSGIYKVIPGEYLPLIDRIEFFMSEPFAKYRYEDDYLTGENDRYWYAYEENGDIENYIKDIVNFHKIHEISINELTEEIEKVVNDNSIYFFVRIPKKDIFLTKKRLDIIDSHSYLGVSGLTYNSRFFISNVKQILSTGYRLKIANSSAETPFKCFCLVKIETSEGDFIVLTNAVNAGAVFGISMMYCYPDYRATELIIYVQEESTTSKNLAWEVKRMKMTPIKDQNISFVNLFIPLIIISDNISYKKVIVPEENRVIHISNRIKISALYNPMIYPLDYDYIIGHNLVGLSANNLSIDASNFGMYPVFAFTEGGIYAMELGRDGETLVQRIVPLSGDVCINLDSITNIGGATLFASTDGLRVLAGQRSEKITTPLELYSDNPLKGATLKNGANALDAILKKYGLQGYVSSEADFQTFLAGAKCYFHYKENEVVITNEAYPYSYVYSLNTKMYHKVFERYYNVFNDYPNAYGTDANGYYIYNLGEEVVPLDARRNVLIQTNAFKLTTDGFEMIRRIFTRFGWSAAPAGSRIGIYLFVSNDTRKWAWVDGCEITQTSAPHGAQNFSPLRCPASIKYGMLVIAGDMDMVNDYLTHISVEWEQRYGNKIR